VLVVQFLCSSVCVCSFSMLTQHALDDVFVQVNMAVETAASKAVERALQALKSQVRVNQMSFWHIYLLPFFV
jgi:hypothetical protein